MKKEKDIIKKKIQWPSRSLENREKKTVERLEETLKRFPKKQNKKDKRDGIRG